MNKDEVISNLEEMFSIVNNETAIALIHEAKKLKRAEHDKAYQEGYEKGYARAMLDYGLED